MIKLLGGVLIISGCLGLGIWYRDQFIGRIKIVSMLQVILELLAGEVRYGRTTLPEGCSRIAEYLQEPFSSGVAAIGARMEANNGDSFGDVFREEMQPVLKNFPLKQEDEDAFFRFTLQTGFTDGQMQLRAIEQSMEILHTTEVKLEKENIQKCKMALGLGAMSGLLLILVLW